MCLFKIKLFLLCWIALSCLLAYNTYSTIQSHARIGRPSGLPQIQHRAETECGTVKGKGKSIPLTPMLCGRSTSRAPWIYTSKITDIGPRCSGKASWPRNEGLDPVKCQRPALPFSLGQTAHWPIFLPPVCFIHPPC